MTKKRIWELDFVRGIALVGMIGIHLIYDLVDLFGILRWDLPQWYLLFKNNYGALFLLISGISATLGSRCIRRGVQVFAAGFLVSGVTVGMYLIGMAGQDIIIYFGVLQCLGTCMVMWALLKRLPTWALVGLGLSLFAGGLYLRMHSYPVPWYVIPIGFTPRWFASSDYFPLLPNLGYFLLGAAAGRTFYADKTTRFPKVNPQKKLIALFCTMGEHSLLIYLLHQPILAALCGGLILLTTFAVNG